MASLQPGIRSASTLGDFNFSLQHGGYTINGARTAIACLLSMARRRPGRAGTITASGPPTWTPRRRCRCSRPITRRSTEGGGRTDPLRDQSGGKDFHGSAYEYFRNSALNANTWARNQRRPRISHRHSAITSTDLIWAGRSTFPESSTPAARSGSSSWEKSGCGTASPIPRPRRFPPLSCGREISANCWAPTSSITGRGRL